MNRKTHELKILPEYFNAVRKGTKKFEVRKNDRDFHAGDVLCLREWNGEDYTGASVDAIVTFVLYGSDWCGIESGWCIMSIDIVT